VYLNIVLFTVKETSSVLKRSRRKNKESQNDSKNGGTWPKARANFILEENSTGTIVQPRSRKERPPLSILLSPPTKLPPEPQRSNINRNSNPIPLGHAPLTQATAPARHSVYKSIESSPAIEHFPKPAPLAIHNPFSSPTNINYDKIRTLEKDKMSISDYSEHDITPNRLSLVLNPSDDSLDYQPVTRNRNKSPHSLDFIVNKGPTSLDFVSRKSPRSLEHSIKNHQGKDLLDNYYSSKKSSSPKTVNKYPSDSDSFGPDSINSNANYPMTGTLPTQSRLQSQYYRGPFVNSNPHPSRYPHLASPTNIPQSQSGESIGTSYDMHSFTSHTHNMSDLQPVPRTNRVGDYHHTYEGGTFPRKKENQRFRIPSNPSVTSKNSAGKLSTGSIERSSERNSPMPTFHVEVLSPGRGAKQMTHKGTRNSMPEYCGLGWDKPLPGELRRVHIDKSQQPLGIQIYCPPSSGGVFVSTVNENSLASQVGLQIGDQLLEVCGINMRSATYTLAARVLRQIGNSITMLVQYSPEKYKDEVEVPGSSSSGESSHDEEVSLSGSPTPRNSPGPQQSLRMEPPSSDVGTLRQSGNKELPRFLLVEMRNCSDLGISLVGGNAVGIFVHTVQIDSPAYIAGLRTGDQILEYNNVDLRQATAELAALELAKPAEKVRIWYFLFVELFFNLF
jgi:discs large protein 5